MARALCAFAGAVVVKLGVEGALWTDGTAVVRVPAAQRGRARPIVRPPGRLRRLGGDAHVTVNQFAFSDPNLSIPRGHRITWLFDGSTRHDATLAAGPMGFASPTTHRGATWSQRFAKPGEYRIYCSFHPVYMSQYLRVR